jgi:hypothetical protein
MLAMANEFDAVVRADRPYLLSLIELHHSAGQAASLADERNSPCSNSANTTYDSSCNGAVKLDSSPAIAQARTMWPLPPPEYYPIGEIVVFKVSVPELSNAVGLSALALKAIKVHPAILSSLVFCNTKVHSRVHYANRVQMILEGRFNNGTGWQEGGKAAVGWRDPDAPDLKDVFAANSRHCELISGGLA